MGTWTCGICGTKVSEADSTDTCTFCGELRDDEENE